MNANAELLNFIYQNSQMGTDTLKQLIDIVEDDKIKAQLESQFKEYKDIHCKCKSMLNDNGYDEKGISAFAKMRTYLMINMQTMKDKTASHIAEMLIIGSNMGVIQAIRKINDYQKNAEKDIVDLMEELLKFEENNICKLKKYL